MDKQAAISHGKSQMVFVAATQQSTRSIPAVDLKIFALGFVLKKKMIYNQYRHRLYTAWQTSMRGVDCI